MALSIPTASASLPTSTESSTPQWKYDVFLNYRSVDGRDFASYLNNELQNREVKTFKDDNRVSLSDGYGISPSIKEAIQKSRFAIVVLTENYASSGWCLDELTYIIQCMETKETILPVFYHVDPFVVRNQRGAYGKALHKHEETRRPKYRAALKKMTYIPGWHTSRYESERHLVKEILQFVCSVPIGTRQSMDRTFVFNCLSRPKRQHVHRFLELKSAPRWKHDVFINFRGVDTRKGFIAYLYRELQNTKVIKTFKDDVRLEKGTVIASNLLMAIEESRFAIIVLSEKYADSTWCLDELAKIFQCMEGKGTILPIFYKLDPAVVRYQSKSFGEAFMKHEARGQDNEKMNQWRAALKGVAAISGWHSDNYQTDADLAEDIMIHLLKKLQRPPLCRTICC